MSRRVYVGVMSEIPSGTATKNLSVANLTDFFTVSNGSGTNTAWTLLDSNTGKIALVPGNIGVSSSTASITLTAKQALTNVVISGQYYTETNFDTIKLTVAGTSVLNTSGNSSLANRYTGSLAAGKAIVLTYSKDSSTDADNEAETKFYIACDAIQAPSGATESKSVARRVKKIYVGVNGIARLVKRAYVGVSNLARQFFGGYDAIQKVENPTRFIHSPYNDSLNYSMQGFSAGTVKNKYALFAGASSGYNSTYYDSKYVYAVDSQLVVTSAANLLRYSSCLSSASLNDYVVFAKGASSTTVTTSSSPIYRINSEYAYAYGVDLTRHDLENLTDAYDSPGSPAGNGQYVIYPGYQSAVSGTFIHTVYSNDLVKSEISSNALADRIGSVCAGRFGNYALFFGGESAVSSASIATNAVCAYDQNLIKSSLANMTTRLRKMGECAATPSHIAVMGGCVKNDDDDTVEVTRLDVYDKNLVKLSTSAFLSPGTGTSGSQHYFGATNIDNWLIVGGGYGKSTVNIFDENLIRTTDGLVNYSYVDYATASIGDYGIFYSSYNLTIFQGV